MSETYPERTFTKRYSRDILPPAYESGTKVVKYLQFTKFTMYKFQFFQLKVYSLKMRKWV